MCKKYCKNCQFITNTGVGCEPHIVEYNEYIGEMWRKVIISGELPNITGDCRYYKRKWWKFWVK